MDRFITPAESMFRHFTLYERHFLEYLNDELRNSYEIGLKVHTAYSRFKEIYSEAIIISVFNNQGIVLNDETIRIPYLCVYLQLLGWRAFASNTHITIDGHPK